jgi:hypothetical protein
MISKFPTFYIQRFVVLLMSGLVITAGVFTFGNANLFDRISLLAALSIMAYFYSDKNLVTILLIVTTGRFFDEIMWLIHFDTYWYKIIIYTAALWIFYIFRYDSLAKIGLVGLFLVCVAEIHWFISDYETPPHITWPVILMIEEITVRHFLFMRPVIFKKVSSDLKSLPLDWRLYKVSALFLLLLIASILEYLVRHVLFINSLFIYNAYPYIAHALACFILWIVLNDVLKRASLFKA